MMCPNRYGGCYNPQLRNYQIIHLATHGILNSEAPELSGVVLSLVDQQGNPQNGFLRLHDIFNLNLPAELVVLSACQTGLGEEMEISLLLGSIYIARRVELTKSRVR